MRRNKAFKRFFLLAVCGLCIGMLCACSENGEQNKLSENAEVLSEEERTVYEAYLQAEYAGGDYLYAYCDIDEDGAMELYLCKIDQERNFGRVMKYLLGGVAFLESGEIPKEYIESLNWMEMPWENSGEKKMVHEGICVYTDQNAQIHEFWYPDERTFLEQYGFAGEEPFYEYILPDGTRRLKFYYNEETELGCGIDYYERDSSDIMTSGACGFTFQGVSEEVYRDGLAVDYGRFETVDGDVLSGGEGYEENAEYEASGQVSHYEVNGVVEEGEEPELLLWMDYQYYPNGNLKERFYYHNPRMFGTWYTTWQSYFDTQGRLEHEYIYNTHGWMEYYYLYEEERNTPAYCLVLDNNLGWFMPDLITY